MIEWIQAHAQELLVGGGAVAGVVVVARVAIALGLKLRAARLRADDDPRNDGEAAVLEEAAEKVAPK